MGVHKVILFENLKTIGKNAPSCSSVCESNTIDSVLQLRLMPRLLNNELIITNVSCCIVRKIEIRVHKLMKNEAVTSCGYTNGHTR